MAANPNLLAGIANLTIDGVAYMVAGSAKYQVSGVTRETKKGQSGVDGYSEMPREGKISMSLRDAAGLSNATLNAMTNSTVVLGLANGKTIVGRNMWNVGTQDVDTQEGSVDIEFEGKSVVEA